MIPAAAARGLCAAAAIALAAAFSSAASAQAAVGQGGAQPQGAGQAAPAPTGAPQASAAQSATAQSPTAQSAAAKSASTPAATAFEGSASWYGDGSAGKPTASGEAYDPEAYTAAHRDLPFGSLLRVTSLDSGASVVVRINDRVPKSSRNALVVSRAAARVLGMLAAGEARVACSAVAPEEAASFGRPRPAEPAAGVATAQAPEAPARLCRIVVASYRDDASARATLERLRLSGLDATLEREGATRRIVFQDLLPAKAEAVAERLRGLGYAGLVMSWYTR